VTYTSLEDLLGVTERLKSDVGLIYINNPHPITWCCFGKGKMKVTLRRVLDNCAHYGIVVVINEPLFILHEGSQPERSILSVI
jgi:hypothetical protein